MKVKVKAAAAAAALAVLLVQLHVLGEHLEKVNT
jgi:hypothetical protein